MLTKEADFIGRGHVGREQQGSGTQEKLLCHMARSLKLSCADELASGLSLVNHSDSESFLVVHACITQPRWKC